jgi:hypothetical protein
LLTILILNEGTVVAVHNRIMLVYYIPSTERLRKFNDLLDVIKNHVNDNGNLSHHISGLASVSRGHSRLSCGKMLMAGSHHANTKSGFKMECGLYGGSDAVKNPDFTVKLSEFVNEPLKL